MIKIEATTAQKREIRQSINQLAAYATKQHESRLNKAAFNNVVREIRQKVKGKKSSFSLSPSCVLQLMPVVAMVAFCADFVKMYKQAPKLTGNLMHSLIILEQKILIPAVPQLKN